MNGSLSIHNSKIQNVFLASEGEMNRSAMTGE